MKEIHLICNAHIDPIWQWDWQEGVSATLSTFRSAVELAEEYDYIFCHNEVTVYKYVEEYAPALFEKIQELVKRGKWYIMGGWYLQPDCNMPSGESFVRQILEGRRYFMEKFGVAPTTAINFDPFGHTVGLPQIIKKCGQDGYLFMRPYPGECPLPNAHFLWKSPDGSCIKAVRTGSYNTPLGSAAKVIKERAAQKQNDVCVVTWGVGNHGGGPSRKDLADIKHMIETENDSYIHSTPENLIARINPTDVVEHSLRISMPGCYTSMAKVKKKHALLENELFLTEKMLSVAYAKGLLKEYPEQELHAVVQDLLNAEFHDVLPGTSIQCGEENGLKLLDHGLLDIERLKTRAYFALLSSCPPAAQGEYPIILFNPHPYPVTENVECEFMLADQNWDEQTETVFRLYDEQGNEIPLQIIKEESNLNLDWRKRIIFKATLEPFGLHRFSAYPERVAVADKVRTACPIFDNGHKYVEIDPQTGLLKSYRIDGVEYVKDGFCPVSFTDNADPWAMAKTQLARVGEQERPFMLSAEPQGIFAHMKSVQIIEDGEVCLSVEAFFEQDNTRARILYKIYKNNDYIDVDVTLFMGDIDRIFKLKVPVCVEGTLIGQTAFATEELYTDARENVAQRFVALKGEKKSLAVMNTGTYGSHFEKGALYLSLARGVTYCAHPIQERPLIPYDRFTKKIDQGETTYSFRLGVVDNDALERETQIFTQKPYGLNVYPLTNPQTAEPFSFSLADASVAVITVKKADDREAMLIRLHNNTDHAVDTALTVNGVMLPLSFGCYEVKTVRWDKQGLIELDHLAI